jgi:thiol-disulfide isomerase/thioredoxin
MSLCVVLAALVNVTASELPVKVNLGWLALSETTRGWRVEKVREEGDWNIPLVEGDLVTQIRDQAASDMGPISVAALLGGAFVHPVPVTVERDGRSRQVEVLANDPDSIVSEKQLSQQYGTGLLLTSEGGVRILQVKPGSPGEKAGLRSNDRIVSVDGRPVNTLPPAQVSELLRSTRPSPVKLRVSRDGSEFEVEVGRIAISDLYPLPKTPSLPLPLQKRADPAPKFDLESYQGQRVKLDDFRGKWVLLNFWGVWCAPCTFEMSFLDAWKKRYGDRLIILGLDVGDKPEVLHRYLERHPRPYPVLIAGQIGEPLADAYGINAIPLNVVLDPKGEIRYVEVGFEPASPDEPPPLDSYLRSVQP